LKIASKPQPIAGQFGFHSHRGFSPVTSIASDLNSRFNGFLSAISGKTVETVDHF
jgi:hypothetical protein